jgi:hypothetical protein
MEAEKLSETITKAGETEKNPHAIKAIIISIFAVVLSIASLGGAEELKTISANSLLESNFKTISEFRELRKSLLQVSIDQLEINLSDHSILTPTEKSNLIKTIERLKEGIQLNESNAAAADGKKEIATKIQNIQQEKIIAKAKNKSFEYGEALLQIAIILISTSIISSIRALLPSGIGLGILGIAAVANGFLLFIQI